MEAGSKKRRRGRGRRNPATRLTDDLVVEILSRLPVKSLCRFQCVSKHWFGLITHPDYRKKLPQTLAGFFYSTYSRDRFPKSARHFTNVTGRGAPLIRPSLSFLPGYGDIIILDCCNGLLLCCYRFRTTEGSICYFVCNPATEEWIPLPLSGQTKSTSRARLGFDSSVSPHFHVFEFVETDEDAPPDEPFVEGLKIYSSKTREWVHRDSGWGGGVVLYDDLNSVFLNGFLHVFSSGHQDVLVVDTEGKAWRTICVPDADDGNDDGFIGLSQGHLYYLNTYEFKLTVYVLENYGTSEWIFKHSANTEKLLDRCGFDSILYYNLISVHPECNLIFFVSYLDNTIRCYDMEHGQVAVICNMGCMLQGLKRCLAYVPLFSESSGWN